MKAIQWGLAITIILFSVSGCVRKEKPEQTAEAWLNKLCDKNPEVRVEAARKLYKLQGQNAIPALFAALQMESLRIDIIAENLANINTEKYRRYEQPSGKYSVNPSDPSTGCWTLTISRDNITPLDKMEIDDNIVYESTNVSTMEEMKALIKAQAAYEAQSILLKRLISSEYLDNFTCPERSLPIEINITTADKGVPAEYITELKQNLEISRKCLLMSIHSFKGKAAIPYLLEQMKDKDPTVQCKAAEFLCILGNPAGKEFLAKALQSTSSELCITAAYKASRLRDRYFIPFLIEALNKKNDDYNWLRSFMDLLTKNNFTKEASAWRIQKIRYEEENYTDLSYLKAEKRKPRKISDGQDASAQYASGNTKSAGSFEEQVKNWARPKSKKIKPKR